MCYIAPCTLWAVGCEACVLRHTSATQLIIAHNSRFMRNMWKNCTSVHALISIASKALQGTAHPKQLFLSRLWIFFPRDCGTTRRHESVVGLTYMPIVIRAHAVGVFSVLTTLGLRVILMDTGWQCWTLTLVHSTA